MTLKLVATVFSLALLTGCRTPSYDVNGTEFTRLVESRKFGEWFELRRSVWGRHYYADWYVLPPTQSLLRFEKRYRTSARELTAEQFEALKKKQAEASLFQLNSIERFFKGP